MIDFRYLLITVVAIFLALTIGILVGSGFLGEPLRKNLEARVEAVRDRNDQLLQENDELETVIGESNRFAEAVEQYMVEDRLQGRQVVLFTFDESNGSVVEEETAVLEQAAADLISTITISQKFELAGQGEAEELRAALQTTETDGEALLQTAARTLGSRVAAAGEDVTGQTVDPVAAARLEETLEGLEQAGFITVDRKVEEETVPPAALFLVAGGSQDPPAFDTGAFATTLATSLADRDAEVQVVEPTDSAWGLVASIREDAEARTVVSTVDDADRAEGRIAMVLVFDQPSEEPAGHYGIEDGATGGVIPDALPGG